jgi:hypothetical protein
MPRTPIADTLGELEKLVQSVTPEDRAGRPHIDYAYVRLQKGIERIHQLITARDFHEARKQEATREIQELLPELRKEGRVVRLGLKFELGTRSEELVRFGMKPFRGRKRRKKSAETPDAEGSSSSEEPST